MEKFNIQKATSEDLEIFLIRKGWKRKIVTLFSDFNFTEKSDLEIMFNSLEELIDMGQIRQDICWIHDGIDNFCTDDEDDMCRLIELYYEDEIENEK